MNSMTPIPSTARPEAAHSAPSGWAWARHELHALLDTFCEDLLSSDQLKWADACPVHERTMADLMGETQDPALRVRPPRLCAQLAEVDAHVDDGESIVLVAAVEHWGLHREMLRSSSRN